MDIDLFSVSEMLQSNAKSPIISIRIALPFTQRAAPRRSTPDVQVQLDRS